MVGEGGEGAEIGGRRAESRGHCLRMLHIGGRFGLLQFQVRLLVYPS